MKNTYVTNLSSLDGVSVHWNYVNMMFGKTYLEAIVCSS
jgi:hypothetical protein